MTVAVKDWTEDVGLGQFFKKVFKKITERVLDQVLSLGVLSFTLCFRN